MHSVIVNFYLHFPSFWSEPNFFLRFLKSRKKISEKTFAPI